MGNRWITILVVSAGFCLVLSCGISHNRIGSYDVLALTNGFLIDGTGSEPLAGATVVMRDGRITEVGGGTDIRIPDNATIVDLDGATVLPGFINAHVHDGFNESNLKVWAKQGVTTVRDLGANPQRPLSEIRSQLMADTQNARLVYAGPLITVPGGYPIVPFGPAAALPIESAEDARLKVNELLDNGADVIKIALERGDIFRRTIPVLTEEMAAVICSVAHARGTVVSAHITSARDIPLAIDAGVDDLAHMAVTRVPDDIIARLVNDGTYWVPTLELWHGSSSIHLDRAIDNLLRFVGAGGKVALGTDFEGYTCPFQLGMPIHEIGWMLDADMTPMQIIIAATKNAAAVCNLQDEIGTIEAGKIADILVVYGNPLENIEEAISSVRMVIHNGVIIVDNRR